MLCPKNKRGIMPEAIKAVSVAIDQDNNLFIVDTKGRLIYRSTNTPSQKPIWYVMELPTEAALEYDLRLN